MKWFCFPVVAVVFAISTPAQADFFTRWAGYKGAEVIGCDGDSAGHAGNCSHGCGIKGIKLFHRGCGCGTHSACGHGCGHKSHAFHSWQGWRGVQLRNWNAWLVHKEPIGHMHGSGGHRLLHGLLHSKCGCGCEHTMGGKDSSMMVQPTPAETPMDNLPADPKPEADPSA